MLLGANEADRSFNGDNQNDAMKKRKKEMPPIKTYHSEEEDDDDLEDDAPLSEIRAVMAPFPACDGEFIDLTTDSTPPSSDSEADASNEEDASIASVMSKAGRISLYKWLNSGAFNLFRRSHSSSLFRDKERVPRSFVIYFCELLQSKTSPSSNSVMAERNFGAIAEEALKHWKCLSLEERRAYRKRAVHSKASYSNHLLEYQAKLNSLVSQKTPTCANPACQQSVVFDKRWNLDYCSSDCVVANCKEVFKARLKPPSPPVLTTASENLTATSSASTSRLPAEDKGTKVEIKSLDEKSNEVEDSNKSTTPSGSMVSPMEIDHASRSLNSANIFDRFQSMGMIGMGGSGSSAPQ
ncbi:hypothetical protein Aperf_G00000123003 [Anoplocephala perfoliata]